MGSGAIAAAALMAARRPAVSITALRGNPLRGEACMVSSFSWVDGPPGQLVQRSTKRGGKLHMCCMDLLVKSSPRSLPEANRHDPHTRHHRRHLHRLLDRLQGRQADATPAAMATCNREETRILAFAQLRTG